MIAKSEDRQERQVMASVTAYFFDVPGGPRDKAAHAIFRNHGGQYVGAGTFMITGERDVQYDVPFPEPCREALKKAGFRLESRS